MNWVQRIRGWTAFAARRAGRRASGPDFGDVGTAFGLEASVLDPLRDPEPSRSGDQPAASAAADRLARRLVRRSGL